MPTSTVRLMLSMMPSSQPATYMKASTVATTHRMQSVEAMVMMTLRVAARSRQKASATDTLAHRMAVSTSTLSVRMIIHQKEFWMACACAAPGFAFCAATNASISSYTGSTCADGVKGARPVWKSSFANRTSDWSLENPICCAYGLAYGGPCALNHSAMSATVSSARSAGSGHVRPRPSSSHALTSRTKHADTDSTARSLSSASAASHSCSMCACAAVSEMSHVVDQMTSPRSLASVGSRLSLLMPATPNTASHSTEPGSVLPPLASLIARDGCSKRSRSSTERQNSWSSGRNCAGSLLVSTCVAATMHRTTNTKKAPTIGFAYSVTKRACGPPKKRSRARDVAFSCVSGSLLVMLSARARAPPSSESASPPAPVPASSAGASSTSPAPESSPSCVASLRVPQREALSHSMPTTQAGNQVMTMR
mmetsp:Transcript_11631/g.40722  ORF Transcript_11631/g.40722 Transcript_11631/m.40722 type:complete len:424 (-) Transcript_11631:1548-2819(-)